MKTMLTTGNSVNWEETFSTKSAKNAIAEFAVGVLNATGMLKKLTGHAKTQALYLLRDFQTEGTRTKAKRFAKAAGLAVKAAAKPAKRTVKAKAKRGRPKGSTNAVPADAPEA